MILTLAIRSWLIWQRRKSWWSSWWSASTKGSIYPLTSFTDAQICGMTSIDWLIATSTLDQKGFATENEWPWFEWWQSSGRDVYWLDAGSDEIDLLRPDQLLPGLFEGRRLGCGGFDVTPSVSTNSSRLFFQSAPCFGWMELSFGCVRSFWLDCPSQSSGSSSVVSNTIGRHVEKDHIPGWYRRSLTQMERGDSAWTTSGYNLFRQTTQQ